VTSFEAAPSATGPCAVTAEAQFEDAVPLIAKTDVLWVSGRDFGSRPHLPLPKGVLERARASLPEALAESCKQPSSSTSRGSESGTFVNLVCSAPTGETSTLVLLPSKGPAQILLSDGGDEGRLTLVDVLDPARKSGHALLLSREVDGGRRMELWETEGRELKRVQSWGF
jgi:hypothetical protein